MDHALYGARLSWLAYQNEADAVTTLRRMGASRVKVFDVENTQGYLAEFDDEIAIVFRGTTYYEIMDLIDVACVLLTPFAGGGVHSGFLDHAASAWPVVFDTIRQWGRKPVSLYGHSLGGACADITAVECVRRGVSVRSVTTYGCPRVGDAEFAGVFDILLGGDCRRYVNANDGVPRVPFLFGLYDHRSGLRYISSRGKLWRDPSYLRVLVDRWGWFKNSPWRWASDKVVDHLLAAYIDNLLEVGR